MDTRGYASRPTSPLKVYRVAAGLTQADLAAISGVARLTIWRVENGVSAPRPATAAVIAAALGKTTMALFGDSEKPGDKSRLTAAGTDSP